MQLGTRCFSQGDVDAFARLSGDYNPLHTDAVIARRLMFGGTVAHGIYVLAWALDALITSLTNSKRASSYRISALHAVFRRPVLVGEQVECEAKIAADASVGELIVSVTAAGQTRCAIRVVLEESHAPALETRMAIPPNLGAGELTCRDLNVDEAAQASGVLALFLDSSLAARLFPSLVSALSRPRLAELFATTRLVGMECPGRNSVFSELSLRFHDPIDGLGTAPPTLDYRVVRANRRYGKLVLEASGTFGTMAEIIAFVRPSPALQASVDELRQAITPTEFVGQRALVVGGSRGLGEVTAKLVAAGGGELRLTYRAGRADAEKLVSELCSSGCAADCFELDVRSPPTDLRGSLGGWAPTHLYYFATPYITSTEVFSPARFREFCSYYVEGFHAVVRSVRASLADPTAPLVVVYPSTVLLDAPQSGFAEYVVAKAAGEALCARLTAEMPNVRFRWPRLPRVRTDQTVSLSPVHTEDPVEVMLNVLREGSADE